MLAITSGLSACRSWAASKSTAADIRTSGAGFPGPGFDSIPDRTLDRMLLHRQIVALYEAQFPHLDFDVWLSDVERASRGIHLERNPV